MFFILSALSQIIYGPGYLNLTLNVGYVSWSISFLIFFAKAFTSFHMLEHTVFFLSLTDYVSQGTFAPPPELLSNTADLFRF